MSTAFEVPPGFETESGLQTDYLFAAAERPYQMTPLEAMGVNPLRPTEAKPGSVDKVAMLAARYAAGLPLWNDGDCVDHGPVRSLLGLDA